MGADCMTVDGVKLALSDARQCMYGTLGKIVEAKSAGQTAALEGRFWTLLAEVRRLEAIRNFIAPLPP